MIMSWTDPCRYKDCCYYDFCGHYSDLKHECRESYENKPRLIEKVIKWVDSHLFKEKPCINRFVHKNDGRRMKH